MKKRLYDNISNSNSTSYLSGGSSPETVNKKLKISDALSDLNLQKSNSLLNPDANSTNSDAGQLVSQDNLGNHASYVKSKIIKTALDDLETKKELLSVKAYNSCKAFLTQSENSDFVKTIKDIKYDIAVVESHQINRECWNNLESKFSELAENATKPEITSFGDKMALIWRCQLVKYDNKCDQEVLQQSKEFLIEHLENIQQLSNIFL